MVVVEEAAQGKLLGILSIEKGKNKKKSSGRGSRLKAQ
jgi:hypothetical protein